MRSQMTNAILFVAGCLILPAGPLLSGFFLTQGHEYSGQAPPVVTHNPWVPSLWYVIGIVAGIVLFISIDMYYPRAVRRGIWTSQIADVVVSIVLGIMIMKTDDIRFFMSFLGFTAVAYGDYVRRHRARIRGRESLRKIV